MNIKLVTRFIVAIAVLVVSSPVVSVAQYERAGEQQTGLSRDVVRSQVAAEPGWPMPDKPIPYHRPGHASTANTYTTQVEMLGDDGLMETVTLSGVDAMVADGIDPLAGNHTLVSWDQLLRGVGDRGEVETFSIVTEDDDGTEADERTISPEPDSLLSVGDRSLKIAGADLNGDDQAEQVAAWLDGYDQVNFSIGELPGSFGRTTSAPAVIAGDGSLPNGYALDFDGVDDYVAAGTNINLATASFTVAFWAKRDVIDKDAFVVGQLGASPSVNTALHIGFRSNNLFTCAFLANDLNTPAPYTDPGWHHWACTYDAVTNLRTIYRDGVEVAHDVASADYQGSGPLGIGQFGNVYFDGLIDEVGIWNVPRTQIQIQADMVRSTPDMTDLEAYWPLNDGQGSTTAVDISGNEHNGTLVNEPAWSEGHAPAGDLHVLVRGYDQALWHGAYEVDTGRCLWEREGGGGLMLSSPTVVPLAAGQFEVYAILADMLTYRRAWNGSTWSASWELVDDPTYWQPLDSLVPVPDLAAPAVVRHDGEVDIFRLGPDNTLRWRHSDDGTTWDPWENLGGMLASGPAAVSPSPDSVQVFAQGADGNLWAWTYNGTEGAWQLVELNGMAEGVTLASAPAVVSPATGEIMVYARGSDDHLWTDHYDGSTWGLWSGGGDGEGTLASGVGAAVLGGETYLLAQTGEGGLQIKRAGEAWAAFHEGLPPCCNITSTGLTGYRPSLVEYKDYSVDVETGHFWGDGRSQIVLGMLRDATHLEIALFDLSTHQDATGFTPVKVNLSDYVVVSTNNIQAFAVTTGDFLGGDGVDDVALIYVAGTQYFVQVLRFDRVTRTLETAAVVEGATPDSAYDRFNGTLEIVSGDFDDDGRDEFASSMGWARLYTRTGFLCSVPSQAFDFVTRIFDVDRDGATFTLKQFQLEGYWNSEHLTRDVSCYSVSITLAAGDTVGDGVDRLVRTWPVDFSDDYNTCLARYPGRTDLFRRTGQVIALPKNANADANAWQVDASGNLEGTTKVDLPDRWWTSRSYADRLVVGDFDRDRVGEIVWYFGTGTSTPGMTTEVYKYDPGAATYVRIVSVNRSWLGGLNDLATADFKAQSLRVGPPSYRIQNRVDSLVAVINVPPKHRDYVKFDDGSGNIRYELFEVGLDSSAQHAMSTGTESEMGIQSQRDWAVGGGLDSKVTMGGFYVDTSLEYSYGRNFVEAEGTISATSFTQSAEASTSDKIVYFSTPYQVWEYPVLVDGSQQPADYIVVEFPVPAYSGNQAYTRAADTTKGDHIEAPWYRAGHQTYNAWSYDPIGEPVFPDYDPAQLIYAPQSTGGGDTYAFSEGSTTILETEKAKTHDFSAEVGVGYEGGFSFLGAKFGAEVRVHVNGSYSSSDLQTEKLTTSESTDITWTLSDQTELARTFTIKSYGYWAKDGYLVLDYQTLVPKAGDWDKYYSSPDPAFVLPWAGFPYGSAPVAPTPGLERFSPEIQVVPESAGVGETVSISATVRNFSNATAYDVLVRFCQEDPGATCAPGGAAHIAEVSIARLDRNLDGPVTVSVPWTASGSGKQRVYAVIDPENAIDEVHDEDDLINNNIAYTVFKVGAAGFVDHGVAVAEPYAGLRYDQGNDWTVAAYIPPGNLSEIVHFELRDAELSVPGAIGQPFELVSYEGEDFYEAPNYDLSLRPGSADPPAVIALAQSDVSVATLKLYRATNSTGSAWAEATCDGHQIVRIPDQGRIYAPICRAGLYVFARTVPGATLAPVAHFSATPTSGEPPLTVYFTDQSTNTPTSWVWEFGDGNTSTEQHPVHVYTVLGTYTVTLTATNAAGSDDVTASSLINVTSGKKVYLPLVVR